MSRINPYTALKSEFREWINASAGRRKIMLWRWPDPPAGDISNLAQRVIAAQQLGYEVQIRHNDKEGLVVEYIKKLPDPPWWW